MSSARRQRREVERAANRMHERTLKAHGPRCAAKVVWQIRRELHLHGYKDLYIPDGVAIPVEFLAAFECLRRRRGWKVETFKGPEGKQRTWRITWLLSEVHRARTEKRPMVAPVYSNAMDSAVAALQGPGAPAKVHTSGVYGQHGPAPKRIMGTAGMMTILALAAMTGKGDG